MQVSLTFDVRERETSAERRSPDHEVELKE